MWRLSASIKCLSRQWGNVTTSVYCDMTSFAVDVSCKNHTLTSIVNHTSFEHNLRNFSTISWALPHDLATACFQNGKSDSRCGFRCALSLHLPLVTTVPADDIPLTMWTESFYLCRHLFSLPHIRLSHAHQNRVEPWLVNPGSTQLFEFRSHAPVSRALCRLVTPVIVKMAYEDGLFVSILFTFLWLKWRRTLQRGLM